MADVFSTPLLRLSMILGLRHRNPIQNARLRSWQILNLCRGGRCHRILIDIGIFNELVIALDILKCFRIEGIPSYPNSTSKIASFLNPWIGIRRCGRLTSE